MAVQCIKQLDIRGLYDVFPLEQDLCQVSSPMQQKFETFSSSWSLESISQFMATKKSLCETDLLRLVGLVALSNNGLEEGILTKLLQTAGPDISDAER